MRSRGVRAFSTLLVTTLLLAAGAAWALDPPVKNWTVPKSWAVGKTASADSPPFPTVFRPVDPCRVIDTRVGSGFGGEWGPPSIVTYGTRSFTITGQCGIPVGASAVSFNFAVWAPTSRGDIRVWPAGATMPTVSTLNWESGILALANAAVIPLGTGGAVSVRNDSSTPIDIFVDVNGYYIGGGNPLSSNERLWIQGSWAGGIIRGTNNASQGYGGLFETTGTADLSAGVAGRAQGATGITYGVEGYTFSSDAGSAGVHGISSAGRGVFAESTSNYGVYGTSTSSSGVYGNSSSSYGVYGTSASGTGVYGYSATGADGVFGKSGDSNAAGVHGQLTASVGSSRAVWGEHQATGAAGIGVYGSHAGSGYGVYGLADGSTGTGAIGVYGSAHSNADFTRGVYGYTNATTGQTYGVEGRTASDSAGSAGVWGIESGASYPNDVFVGPVGVLGNATTGWGVLGKATTGRGVQGCLVNSSTGSSVTGSCGVLGYSSGVGVYSYGDVAAVGAKSFIEPHPADPSRQIVYIAMEGPEAGTYFRGRGRIQGNSAIIVVPESFRLVTEEEGLTVQITPIGRAASVGVLSVLSMGLDQIVIDGQSDVEFSYLVQGVRKGYADMKPVVENSAFVPTGPGDRMGSYPERIRERLVSLGIYHADGTVNMQTAERLGWAKQWREAEQIRQQKISRAPQEQAPQQ